MEINLLMIIIIHISYIILLVNTIYQAALWCLVAIIQVKQEHLEKHLNISLIEMD